AAGGGAEKTPAIQSRGGLILQVPRAAPAHRGTEMATKTKKKTGGAKKGNSAFFKPLNPSDELAAVVGSGSLPRTEATKKIWAYIKKHGLQDSKNRRAINADDKLKAVFGGKKQVTMFELTS